jgi:large subunit ribosomal protein L15
MRRPFSGGQLAFFRRLPKRGFSNARFRDRLSTVNVGTLAAFPSGSEVDPARLQEEGFVPSSSKGVKVLGDGELVHPLTVKAHAFSGSARRKIEAAGGSVQVVS